jgi:hypothetical protein
LRGSRKRNLTRLGKKSPDGRRENIESERDEQMGLLRRSKSPLLIKAEEKKGARKKKEKNKKKRKFLN